MTTLLEVMMVGDDLARDLHKAIGYLNGAEIVVTVEPPNEIRHFHGGLFFITRLPVNDNVVIEQPKHLQRPYWDKKRRW